jgi:hypothetical protein
MTGLRIYLLLVATLILAAFLFMHHLAEEYRPAPDFFQRAVPMDGAIQYGRVQGSKAGSVPLLNGEAVACGINFHGIEQNCVSIFPHSKLGMKFRATAARASVAAAGDGKVWVLVSAQLDDGSHFENSWNEFIETYDRGSRHFNLTNCFFVALLALVLRFMLVFGFRRAT